MAEPPITWRDDRVESASGGKADGGVVGKILRGAKPAEFPIQRPIYLSFLINMRTARLLQLTIPPSLSALADEVIE